MEVTEAKIIDTSVLANQAGTKSNLEVKLFNGKMQASVLFANIHTANGRENVKKIIGDEITVDPQLNIVRGSAFGTIDHTVYVRTGRYGVYGSFTKGFKYHVYESTPLQLSQVGEIAMEDVTYQVDDESSLVITQANGHVTRFINTRVQDGAPVIDAIQLGDNERILNILGETTDFVLAGPSEAKTAKVVVIIKENNDKTKAYAEFGKIAQ